MKKLFVCTVPMLDKNQLKDLDYQNEKGEFMKKSAFPSIVLLDKYIDENDESEIIISTVRDDCENSTVNYERFLGELRSLSEEKNVNLVVSKEITLPHNESKVKNLTIFSELMELYSQKENCKLYIDMTYGTKITSAEVFASLNFADTKGLNIEELCYGFYDHSIKENDIGVYYSIRYVWDLVSLINTSSKFMNSDKLETLIRNLI